MVNIDHQLIYQARLLTTGANVHRMRTYIFLYEQAVKLHNDGEPQHLKYYGHYEKLLREFVRTALQAKTLS